MTSETPTLLVLAAGMGARYGGLKQLEAVGPNGETLMDYAIYDAVRAGFSRVVFLIRRDIAEVFETQIGSRYIGRVEVVYAYQELDDLPEGFTVPEERERPWGTGHATWAAREVVGDSPFAVINADDFYGAETFSRLSESLAESDGADASGKLSCSMAGFRLSETLSEHGNVSRGVCATTDGFLNTVSEWTGIARGPEGTVSGINPSGQRCGLTGEETASMNVWGFPAGVFPLLEKSFVSFLHAVGDVTKDEFYLPSAVDDWIKQDFATVRVRPTPCRWMGVTYKEDKPRVIEALAALVAEGAYPAKLWK
jgi:hypothetical protein